MFQKGSARFLCYFVLWGGAASCGPSDPASQARERLHALFREAWEFQLRENPLFATSVGEHRYDDRLPSMAREDLQRRHAYRLDLKERLQALDRSLLSREDQVNYDIFARELEDDLQAYEFATYRIPITVDSGFHISFARLPEMVPLRTVSDYRNYLARLRAFPRYVAEYVELMRQGLADGFTLPRVVLEGYEVTIASHVVEDPEKSVFWKPFENFPTGVPEEERERLRAEGRQAILEGAVAGYRLFLDFMLKEYVPGARTSLGAHDLPNGPAYYRYLIRHFTTLDLTPEEIHQTGLEEVARIRQEMEEIIREVGFQGDFAQFLEFLRTDPRFYAETPEELLKEACYIAKRMDGKLPALFKTLPRLPYTVAPVPEHLAPKYTGGRYVGAPVGSTQPGYYWVNTYNLRSRPLYTWRP